MISSGISPKKVRAAMEQVKESRQDFNSLIDKLTLGAIQLIIVISVFQMIRAFLFHDLDLRESHIFPYFGSIAATIAAWLLLCKYQNLIKDFSRRTDTLEKMVSERTLDLQKANREMEQEINERKRVQQALEESEARFRTIIQEAAIGMAVVDQEGRFLQSNLALQGMLDYSAEKLKDMAIAQIIYPDDVVRCMKTFKELLTGTPSTHQLEERLIRPDGTIVWGRLSFSLVRDAAGAPLFVIAMVEDISRRREADEKVSKYQKQLQSMTSELSLTEERERRRLATNLHDHIGQALAVAKIKLGLLQQSAASQEIAQPLAEVREIIEQTIQDTRSLTFELSLPVLYDLGFKPAVDWLAKNIHQRHGIKIQVESNGPLSFMDIEVRVLLFQMVRELLFNVVKHAKATMAKVTIQTVADQMQVTVADNGVGFDPSYNDHKVYESNGFGLFSIRERLNYCDGGLQIESEPGHGSRIYMTIPLH